MAKRIACMEKVEVTFNHSYLETDSRDTLNCYLEDGYELLGGPSTDGHGVLHQWIVKYEGGE